MLRGDGLGLVEWLELRGCAGRRWSSGGPEELVAEGSGGVARAGSGGTVEKNTEYAREKNELQQQTYF